MSISQRPSFKQYLQEEFSHYKIPFLIQNYLTELLSFYIRSENFFEKKQGSVKSSEKHLLDLYQKSQESCYPGEKLYFLKSIGDFSLCLTGFFRESLNRKLTHLSYYEDLGESAYYLVGKKDKPRFHLFKELAQNFKALSKILFSLQKKSLRRQKSKYLLEVSEKSERFPIFFPETNKKRH